MFAKFKPFFCSFVFLVMFLNRILYCSVCVVWSMRSKKLSQERESFLFPFPIIVWMWWLWKLLLLEVKLSSFEKMYLRLCGFLTAIIFFCFLVRSCNPNKSWYPATKLPHPDTPRNHRHRPPPCLQLDYHLQRKESLHLRFGKWGPKRQMTERE